MPHALARSLSFLSRYAAGLALLWAAGAGLSHAAEPEQPFDQDPKKGWHWYKAPRIEPEQSAPARTPAAPAPAPASSASSSSQPAVIIMQSSDPEKCLRKAGWTAACGFVDPGDDFEFQAQQRDALLQAMSMLPDNPDVVEHAQRYMKWVVAKASMAANMWYFNMVQRPDLDPTVKNPISEVGLALASRISQASQYEYFRLMREEGGVLFFFSRDNCVFCHEQAPYARRVAATMGLEIINVPLDGVCLPGFSGESCADNIPPEQTGVLDLKVVPTLFLYVPSNTWIRLASGLTTDATVLANAVNFFSAYRAALVQGLDNSSGARPTVSFDPEARAASGTTNAETAQAQAPAAAPTQARLLELMGYKNKASENTR